VIVIWDVVLYKTQKQNIPWRALIVPRARFGVRRSFQHFGFNKTTVIRYVRSKLIASIHAPQSFVPLKSIYTLAAGALWYVAP
jgi:hypothetical protein